MQFGGGFELALMVRLVSPDSRTALTSARAVRYDFCFSRCPVWLARDKVGHHARNRRDAATDEDDWKAQGVYPTRIANLLSLGRETCDEQLC